MTIIASEDQDNSLLAGASGVAGDHRGRDNGRVLLLGDAQPVSST